MASRTRVRLLVVLAAHSVACGTLLGLGDDGDELPPRRERADAEDDAGEVEQDGAVVDASEADAAPAAKRVFVTARSTSAALGGADGGDELCNEEAVASGLPPGFAAYLSVAYRHPAKRLPDAGRWALVDGTVVFEVGPETENPAAPVVRTADGGLVDAEAPVWTGYHPTSPNNRCEEWTTSSNALRAYQGRAGATNGSWQSGSFVQCSERAHLYCFER